MAKIWPIYEGKEPTRGGPWAELPIAEAIRLFELRRDQFVSDYETTPRFGDDRSTQFLSGYKLVVVEVDPSEARRSKFAAGFYKTDVEPSEAYRRLIEQVFVLELGSENVIRVEYTPTTSSTGQEALKITVVLVTGSLQRLKEGAALNALVRVRERLREMGDSRTPTVEYATEAELAQDADT